MSFGIMVTCCAWFVHKLAWSKIPAKKASPASCNAKTAALCYLSPSLLFCTISLTSLWKGNLQIRKSTPFWYFWISLRACIPLCICLCFSILSSLTIFNCFSFLFFFLWALFWFSSLSFFMTASFYCQPPWPFLSLLFPWILLWFLPSLIMEDGPRLVLLVFYQTLFFSIQSEFKMEYINQNSTMNTSICQQNWSSMIPIMLFLVVMSFGQLQDKFPNLKSFLPLISQQSILVT